MARRNVLRLVPNRISQVTRRRLEELLAEAKDRDDPLVGLAYIAIYLQRYKVDAVGKADHGLTLTRGMLRDLDDLLRERKNQRR